jgi:hypothetical protein
MIPKFRDDITLQPVGDEALVLDLRNDTIHQFNATASWIIALLDGRSSSTQIATLLTDVFDIDHATAVNDVNALIDQLGRAQLIEFDPVATALEAK